jgi:TPR repeat protein
MADVAHEPSGPASPKPGDIAPQQASRSDRDKLRVFISYSRDDLKWADQLDAALKACGFECSIDREGISGGEKWKERLGNLISEADTVVFVLSPTSARSEVCAWEVEEATRLGKRILPVICRPLEGASPPPQLRDRNYVFLYEDPKVSDSGFGTGLAGLIAALNTDFDWLREHTRYLQRAIEWNKVGRPANRLLSGDDIAEAKAWVARRPNNAPEPTAFHLDFIRASEEEGEARLSAQRKQLEAMAVAQTERETALHKAEEALKQAADAQRKRARIRNIAFAVVSILAVLAGLLGWRSEQQRKVAEEQKTVVEEHRKAAEQQRAVAEQQRAIAEEQRRAAEEQRAASDQILEGAANIIRRFPDEKIDIRTQKEFLAMLNTGADHGNGPSMTFLGSIYHHGSFGVAQDYGKAHEWCLKAADKGEMHSMVNLGALYASGNGVAQDDAKAREWYEKAADKGDEGSMLLVGNMYEHGSFGMAQDYGKAREWYEKAAHRGFGLAMYHLGLLYEGRDGVAQDYAKARDLYEKAADWGLDWAMNRLGLLYEYGNGVAQDYGKAREWYEKAADKGNEFAMTNLGLLYARGQGVAQDYAKAREWYEKAADKGNEFAKVYLEQLSITEAAAAGLYAEALQRQETLAAKVETVETTREGKRGEETAGALSSVAWRALFAREFTKALIASDRAHALLPKNLTIETNRAHALMFLGRREESKALYLAHRGKPMSGQDARRWEFVIAKDFAEFRKAGLTHPMMAEIEQEFGVSR